MAILFSGVMGFYVLGVVTPFSSVPAMVTPLSSVPGMITPLFRCCGCGYAAFSVLRSRLRPFVVL